MPGLSFFVGKGGVGKTTLSAAYAVHKAVQQPKKRFILLSTDPAHNLSDIFEAELGSAPRAVRLTKRGRLDFWQIDAGTQFRKFLQPHRKALLDLVESGTLFSREEIEPLLDSTLPGMAEVSALLAIDDLLDSDEYEHIVVDTAPIGHTLRLFELPQHFQKFLDFLDVAAGRDQWLASRFGGKEPVRQAFLSEWRRRVERICDTLNTAESKILMVTTPEQFSLQQAVRSGEALQKIDFGLEPRVLIINRARRTSDDCRSCSERVKLTTQAQYFMKRNFPNAEMLVAQDPGQPLLGASALLRFGDHVFAGKSLKLPARKSKGPARVVKTAKWPRATTPLLFTLGKGGVGKTTISAALAFRTRAIDRTRVTVCSIDPAPSLDDVFRTEIENSPKSVLGDAGLFALEVDSVAEFRQWASAIREKIEQAFSMQSGGVHIDLSFDRDVFLALLEVVPPGVDEIFAILKIIELLEQEPGKIVVDMAPTGHALEVLRMPERMLLWTRLLLKSLAAHRTLPLAQDVAVEIATIGQQVRKLLKMLQDSRETQSIVVTLAEPIPFAETRRLLKNLALLKMNVAAVIVNRVPVRDSECHVCQASREAQLQLLAKASRQFRGQNVLIAAEFGQEVSGKAALDKFSRSIWRLQ